MSVKNVYRVTDQTTHNHVTVVAASQADAVAFTGFTHVLSVVEVASGVEIVGTDTPHPRASAPPPPNVIPVSESQLNASEVARVRAALAKAKN